MAKGTSPFPKGSIESGFLAVSRTTATRAAVTVDGRRCLGKAWAPGKPPPDGPAGGYPESLQRTMDLVPLRQNYYSISKAFGEQISCMYATRFDMEVVSVPIGNFNRNRDLPEHPHHFSHGDCVRVFERAWFTLGVRYEVVFGVSDSNWPMYDLDHGKKVLGYEPRDRSVVPPEEWNV